jgi:asparagine synthase (glutamine-hydrolysing)
MCGIAGVWSTAPLAAPDVLASRLDTALAHRGPDGHAWATRDDGRLLFAHRRLAIIDPSSCGSQPMTTRDGRYTIAFNGEVYNHAALRRDLESRGVRFATRSDTEVLMWLVVNDGAQALARVRGMFAFALWDAPARRLLIARDRFGIKPLFVSVSKERVAFASEIGALIHSGLCRREVDAAGVLAYLRWGSIPGPLTWVQGIEAVQPGSWVQWTDPLTPSRGQFADARQLWSGAPERSPREDELRESTRAALDAAVSAHLVADVPVGFFLSGGIDSGALVATATAQRSDLHTFTVVVDESSHSEEPFARAVAGQFGTVHQTIRVDPSAMLREWPAILGRMDQPTIDGINSYFVAGAVAASGIKSVISGIGGDELFGGYPSFKHIPRGTRIKALPRRMRALGGRVVAGSGNWRAHKLQHAAEHADSIFELYRAVRGWMMPQELAEIAGPALAAPSIAARVDATEQAFADTARVAGVHAAVAMLESTMYLRHQLLRDADVMSMAHGLEVRVPFVDHELIGTVWPSLEQHPGLLPGKRLLVESLRRKLPDAIVSRPKQGFTLPFEHWIDGPLSGFIADGLKAAADAGWIAPSAPAVIAAAWKARECHWSRPWGLAVLGHFLHD